MKRAMKQSTLILILNGISILTLLYMVYSLFLYSSVSNRLTEANEERFALTLRTTLSLHDARPICQGFCRYRQPGALRQLLE